MTPALTGSGQCDTDSVATVLYTSEALLMWLDGVFRMH